MKTDSRISIIKALIIKFVIHCLQQIYLKRLEPVQDLKNIKLYM